VVPDTTPWIEYAYDRPWRAGEREVGIDVLTALATRVDGTTLTEGTSRSIFQTVFTDGSVRQVSTIAVFGPEETSRVWVFGLGGDPLPDLGSADAASRFVGEATSGARPARGAFGPGEEIAVDGLSNTILLTEDDAVSGTPAPETVPGGLGDDTLGGDAGGDAIDGGTGADVLTGGAGRDTLTGGDGNDRLAGGAGDDDLFGEGGRDRLAGGGGDDILDGGAGPDRIAGGGGADAFVMALGTGSDRITDFAPDEGDILTLNANLLDGAATGAEVVARFLVATEAGPALDFGGDRVVLVGLGETAGLAAAIDIV
jgi:Ca2+-binding RTX toxin-like protein